MRRSQHGATLTELTIVATLAALLASVGLPAYRGYVERARVTRAVSDIGTLSLQLYRWQLANRDFPQTLAEAGLDPGVDPWGNPYRYLEISQARIGQVRRDRNLRPINNDFDLYSMGPDGDTQTQLNGAQARDDIVRANNGAYIGIAANY
jgi:general secretion pathway protein G